MKVFITLFALIGISWALVPGTEYRYHYEGKIRTGFPEIRNKYSGAGIKTTVIVQVLENKKVLFKFNNIQVGEFLGDVGIKITNPMPMKYVPLKREAKILEEPFEVNFKNYQNEELVVPESDIEWIVNIRKSVVQLFLNEPIRGNFGFSNIFNMEKTTLKAFSIYEPTIYGTCSLDYTLVPVEVSTNDINMEQTTMNKEVYMLTRTINFDKCQDKVSLMFGNVANITNVTNSIYGGISTRSSVMSLKLIGKPGHFEIYEGNVEGFYSMHSLGVPSDKSMFITNQTFFLESTKKITNTLVVPKPNRIIKTIYTEIWSPFKAPVNPVPYFNYHNKKDAFYIKVSAFRMLTGIPLVNEQIKNYKNFLNDLITKAAQLTLSVAPTANIKVGPLNKETDIVALLEKATYFSMLVDFTELERLFETYYTDNSELGQMKMKLFIDVCATSGYYPLKVLVNEMKKGRITPERITSIFTTFVNTFEATPLLQDIMSYVKTLNFKTNPVMTSNVIINFATILKNRCVDYLQGLPEYYGAEICDTGIITEQFIPFLKKLFEDSTDIFERRSITKALANLRTIEAVNFIFEIATGNYAVEVREFAIFGLHYKNVKNVVQKDDVFNTLMPIVQNIKEDPYLRQVAITVLISFKPSPTWWQRLSASTWREPSKSVGSFIYYLIKNYARNTNLDFGTKEERIAKFLLPVTKPYSPSSTYYYVYANSVPEKHFNVFYDSAIYKDDTMDRPRNIYTKYFNNFKGYRFPVFEAMFMRNSVASEAEPKNAQWSKIFSDKLKTMEKTPSLKIVEDIYSEMMKMVNKGKSSSSKLDSTFFTIFENLQAFFPLSLRTTEEKINFFASLMRGTPLGMTKFFDAMELFAYFPTDIGLPFYATFNSPILFSAEGEIKLNMEGAAKNMNMFNPSSALTVDLSTNFKFISKFVGRFEIITPWNEKIISSGIETSKTLNIPVRISTAVQYNGNFKNISFEVMPKYNKEFTAVSVSNIPFLEIRKAYPESLNEKEIFEVISVGETNTGLYKNNYVFDREYTGIDGAIRYTGDIPYPFTYGNFYELFNNPSKMGQNLMSPTTKYFQTDFIFNFGTSETKVFYPSFAFSFPTEKETNMIHNKKTEGEESSFLFTLFLKGTKTRYFESNFQTKVLSRSAETKRTEFVYKYIEQLPGMKPQVLCVNIDTKTPFYKNFKTLFKFLSTNIDYTFVGKIRGGYSCKEAQFATLKGSFKVSNEMRQTLIDKVTKELNINKDSKIENAFEPLYDRVQILVEYKEPLPGFFTNMTYQTYDVLRGSQFPHLYTNYYNVKNPKGRIFVEGERYVDETYNLRVQLPTENVNMDNFRIPFIYKLKMNLFNYNEINEIPILGLFNNIFF